LADDGTFTGKLLEQDETDCTSDAGYYFVKANTNELIYSTEVMNWALTGSATPLGWPAGPDGTAGQDYEMTYNLDTQTLKVTLELTADEVKFRANDAWSLNYGDTGADGSLEEGGDNIKVPSAGNYTVTLDLSNPRDYTYSLVKNN